MSDGSGPPRVQTRELQLILGAKHTDASRAHRYETGTCEHRVDVTVVKIAHARMDVDGEDAPGRAGGQDGEKTAMVGAAQVEIEVAVRTKAERRVETGDRPPLADDDLQPRGRNLPKQLLELHVGDRHAHRTGSIGVEGKACSS